MTRSSLISAGAYSALTDALTRIYWRKNDLRLYLRRTLTNSPELLYNLDWDNRERYKYYIVRDIVERLRLNENRYRDETIALMLDVANFKSFSHLRQYEDPDKKVADATEAVAALKLWTTQYEKGQAELDSARENREQQRAKDKQRQGRNQKLDELRARFLSLHHQAITPQQRGLDFEHLLADLFELSDLDPVRPFRLQGEQIDGAFTFDGTEYLVEARWTKDRMQPKDVREFRGKVSEKFDNTLGLFVSMYGFTNNATVLNLGGRPNVLLADGADITAVLEGRIELVPLLLRKRRHASTTGETYLSVWTVLAEE